MVKFVSSSQQLLLMGVGLSFIGMWDTTTVDWGTMIQNAYSSGRDGTGSLVVDIAPWDRGDRDLRCPRDDWV